MSIKDYYKTFGTKQVPGSVLKNEELANLYKQPKKDKGNAMPRFQAFAPFTQQADLLFLPTDKNYKYALVVIDNYSRKVDAEPLKTKNASEVTKGFQSIYKRNVLDVPKRMETDSGTEFKGVTKTYFDRMRTQMRYAETGRHRQQGLVEFANLRIGTALTKRQVGQELLTGEPSREWVDDLPIIVKQINKNASKLKKPVIPYAPIVEKSSQDLLLRGTKVRVQLDVPRGVAEGERLPGKFRAGDVKWEMKPRIIKEISIRPGFPPTYLVNSDNPNEKWKPVAYTRNQLQIVGEKENPPPKSVIRGEPKYYKIHEILEKKGNTFKIKWKDGDITNEPRSMLEEDVPQMLKEFEDKLKPVVKPKKSTTKLVVTYPKRIIRL